MANLACSIQDCPTALLPKSLVGGSSQSWEWKEGQISNLTLHPFPLEPQLRMEWLRLSGLQEEEVVQRVTRLCSRHFLGGRGPTPGNRVPVLFPYNDFCLAVPCKEIMPWEQSNASQESRNVGEAVEAPEKTQDKKPLAYESTVRCSKHTSILAEGILDLWLNETLCDIVIQADNGKVKAHSVVLAIGMPQLQSNFLQGSGHISMPPGVSVASVRTFLTYLYAGLLSITQDNVVDLKQIANIFQNTEVDELCQEFLNGARHLALNCLELSSLAPHCKTGHMLFLNGVGTTSAPRTTLQTACSGVNEVQVASPDLGYKSHASEPEASVGKNVDMSSSKTPVTDTFSAKASAACLRFTSLASVDGLLTVECIDDSPSHQHTLSCHCQQLSTSKRKWDAGQDGLVHADCVTDQLVQSGNKPISDNQHCTAILTSSWSGSNMPGADTWGHSIQQTLKQEKEFDNGAEGCVTVCEEGPAYPGQEVQANTSSTTSPSSGGGDPSWGKSYMSPPWPRQVSGRNSDRHDSDRTAVDDSDSSASDTSVSKEMLHEQRKAIAIGCLRTLGGGSRGNHRIFKCHLCRLISKSIFKMAEHLLTVHHLHPHHVKDKVEVVPGFYHLNQTPPTAVNASDQDIPMWNQTDVVMVDKETDTTKQVQNEPTGKKCPSTRASWAKGGHHVAGSLDASMCKMPKLEPIMENQFVSYPHSSFRSIAALSAAKTSLPAPSGTVQGRLSGGRKMWVCSQCGKSFPRKYDYYRHVIIHTESRPWKCTQCNYSAHTKTNLKSHVLRRHADVCMDSCQTLVTS